MPLTQNITYTPFSRPETVTEGDYELTFTYGPENSRKKSVLKLLGAPQRTITYAGNYEKIQTGGDVYEVHYLGMGAINVRQNGGADQIFYTYTDHLGSILTLTNASGIVVYEQNFDPWGRKRNPNNWTYTANPSTPPAWLIRGFTGHEHHDEVALINMNARMYDPIVARMLSPDNFVQNAASTQGLNRYSYVLNNPMVYTYPSGNDILDMLFAPFRLFNEGVNYINAQVNGNNNYSFNWNYVATGQLPNSWRNDPDVVLGPNGYPIGLGGEYTAFGDYGYNVDDMSERSEFVDASGTSYTWGVTSEINFQFYNPKGLQYDITAYQWGYKEKAQGSGGDYGNTFTERLVNLPKAIWEGDVFGKNDPNMTSVTIANNPLNWLMGGVAAKAGVQVTKSVIKGFTEHATNQAITRGFKTADILKIVRDGNPVQAMGKYGAQTRYTLGGKTVVVNAGGKVVTVF